jgi:hypothetical protein
MDILTAWKGASLATPEQQNNRKTSLRGGVVVVVVVVVVVPGPVMQVHKNEISSWVQALYCMFSRALQKFSSSKDCIFYLIFCFKMTTVVTWCHNAFPIADSWP